jgi:hypothetical protein
LTTPIDIHIVCLGAKTAPRPVDFTPEFSYNVRKNALAGVPARGRFAAIFVRTGYKSVKFAKQIYRFLYLKIERVNFS